uniref:Cystatin-B n=1 Tax=Oncorhynchus mykiss TaxID=8022 RepID=A0A8K9X8C0_ONCMY
MMMCGAVSQVSDATPKVQQICDKRRKLGKKFDVFTTKTFTTQVVAGTNFFIKVHVGGDEFMHLRVHQTLPHAGRKLELHRVQTPKTHIDPIGFF